MPGLVPGIHALITSQIKDVDGRDKPGHDVGERSITGKVGISHHGYAEHPAFRASLVVSRSPDGYGFIENSKHKRLDRDGRLAVSRLLHLVFHFFLRRRIADLHV